jgi:tripartite-type tricarboxylate transporter receptor subunit TctC
MTRRLITRRTALKAGLSAGLATALPLPYVRAQASWPSKPIRIVCGFPPGGLTDQFSRAYGDYIAEKTGQMVIVENRPGAGGGVAAVALKQAPADGHTLMTTVSATLLGNRILYKSLAYDPDTDFSHVALMPSGHLPIVASKATGAKDLASFAAYAKANKVSGGSYAAGSFAHIALDQIAKHFGVEYPVVQYRGEAPMWQDMAAGASHIACGSYQAAQVVFQNEAGRAIAVPTTKRMRKLPEVPTFAEQGLTAPVYQLVSWTCFVGQAAIPQDIVEKISAMIVEGGKTARLQKLIDTFGIDEAAQGHAEFKRVLANEGPIWLEAARKLNLQQEG